MNRKFSIPDDLVRTATELRGAAGAEWAKRLPGLLADCERRWSLTIGPHFPNLSYNYTAPAVRADGTSLVVKAGFPGDRELLSEAEALRIYAGRGAAQLLDADLDQGVLLLEHLKPGTLLNTLEDDERATSIAAGIMRQLWRPAPAEHQFPSVADWGRGFARLRERFGGRTGPLPEGLADRAERLFAELLGSMSEPVVLHGDLHHFNILAAERQPWLAIDPKGVVGEPAYEVGAFLRNPVPDLLSKPEAGRILSRRLDQLSEELGFERERLRGWGIAQAVLSAWWSIEDHGYGGEASIAFAELLMDDRR